MSQRSAATQSYDPSSSMAACQGSGEETGGGGYGAARHPAVPELQDFPYERARRFVQDQAEGPYLSVSDTTQHHQGWPSDSDNDIELKSSDFVEQPSRQSRKSSGRDTSPRTVYRQVEQRLGVMRTERLARRGYSSDRNPSPPHYQRQQHQDQYFESVRFERNGPRPLIRYDSGQAYRAVDPPDRHQDGGAVRQYEDSEDVFLVTENNAENCPKRV